MRVCPTPGERARTVADGRAHGVLSLADLPQRHQLAGHACDPHGRPLVPVPDDSCPARVIAASRFPEVPAHLEITSMFPVPVPDRVRAQAWLTGRLGPVPDAELRQAACRVAELHPWPELLDVGNGLSVLRLQVTEVRIQDGWGWCTVVGLSDYVSARPDPFIDIEADLLMHLDTSHRGEAATLLRRFRLHSVARPDDVRVVGVDRYGLWLWVTDSDLGWTERLSFSQPVDDLQSLRYAYHELFLTAT